MQEQMHLLPSYDEGPCLECNGCLVPSIDEEGVVKRSLPQTFIRAKWAGGIDAGANAISHNKP